jgi:hypothetical protein
MPTGDNPNSIRKAAEQDKHTAVTPNNLKEATPRTETPSWLTSFNTAREKETKNPSNSNQPKNSNIMPTNNHVEE